jgi:hypothetical protein
MILFKMTHKLHGLASGAVVLRAIFAGGHIAIQSEASLVKIFGEDRRVEATPNVPGSPNRETSRRSSAPPSK